MNNHSFEKLFEEFEIITNPWAKRQSWEEQKRYLRSNKNLEICKPYILECERLANVVKEYVPLLQTLKDKLNQEIATEEYSTGGEVLHRGFYCPSPIIDIVIGNSKRGRILQRMTQESKPTYKYGFNADGELILVTNIIYDINAIGTEIIIPNDNKEIGISFQDCCGERKIGRISECIYHDDQLVTYIEGAYCSFEDRVFSLKKEEYLYPDKSLETAFMYFFTNDKVRPILTHQEYRFKHDNEGYLLCYVSIDHPGSSSREEPFWNGQVYDVRIKRKV